MTKTSRNAKPIDARAPKRAMSAYLLFAADNRKQIVASNPSLGIAQIAKLLGRDWQALSPQKKKAYAGKADKAMKAYKRKMAAHRQTPYFAKHSKALKEFKLAQAKKSARPKDSKAPKRAMSAYFLFAAEHRQTITANHPDMGVAGVAKLLGREWKKLSPQKKAKFVEQAEKEKKAYLRKMTAHKQTAAHKKYVAALKEWKADFKAKEDKLKGIKKKSKKAKKAKKKATKAKKKKTKTRKSAKKKKKSLKKRSSKKKKRN